MLQAHTRALEDAAHVQGRRDSALAREPVGAGARKVGETERERENDGEGRESRGRGGEGGFLWGGRRGQDMLFFCLSRCRRVDFGRGWRPRGVCFRGDG